MLRCSECERLFPQTPSTKVSCPSCGGKLSEDQHAYLPQRVLGGKITTEGFEIFLRERNEFLSRETIKMVCLGIIEEPSLKIQSSAITQMKETVKKAFVKGKKESEPDIKRKSIYLEFFVTEQKEPFRIESSNFNYRDFLEEVEHVSDKNFRKFLNKLMEYLPECEFDASLLAYLSNNKAKVSKFGNIYEFQRSCQDRWLKKRKEMT